MHAMPVPRPAPALPPTSCICGSHNSVPGGDALSASSGQGTGKSQPVWQIQSAACFDQAPALKMIFHFNDEEIKRKPKIYDSRYLDQIPSAAHVPGAWPRRLVYLLSQAAFCHEGRTNHPCGSVTLAPCGQSQRTSGLDVSMGM